MGTKPKITSMFNKKNRSAKNRNDREKEVENDNESDTMQQWVEAMAQKESIQSEKKKLSKKCVGQKDTAPFMAELRQLLNKEKSLQAKIEKLESEMYEQEKPTDQVSSTEPTNLVE